MLHMIIGTAGTGKTTALLDRIEGTARSGGRAILLVPEQLSFESEKKLFRSLGPELSLRVEVLSFTRLCHQIFRAFGGLASLPVSPAGKYLLMSVAVEEVRDKLTVYRKSLGNTAFLQTMVETCGEFKTAGVGPERLAAAVQGCDGLLADKLADLSGIYGAYQALLNRGYADPDDDLIRACELLEANNYFSGVSLYVDGFTTFMAAEFELLGHAIAQADEAWFALTCDELTDRQQGMGVFSPVKQAAQRLIRMAERQGVVVAREELLPQQHRFAHPTLGHIAASFLQPAGEAYGGEAGQAIRLYQATDRYGEMVYVAASIARLVREEGLRYKQIAVVTRDTGPYLRAVERAFGQYGIPYFADERRDVETHPLVAGLLHAVDAVRGNLDAESVLLLAKSVIMGLEPEAVAALENYCYCWGVRGAVWEQDFVANPRGMAGAMEEEDLELLAHINSTRAALAEPLSALRGALAAGSARQFAAGLYQFLQQIQAPDHLSAWAERLPQDQRATFLSESAQIWDTVMDILDVFGTVLGNVSIKRARLCELLRLALGTAEIGLVPQTLDQVLVGMADRIRPVDAQAVFVVGAVEGEFPAQVAASGVFSDAERRQMIEAGIEISQPSLHRAVLEQFFAYYAVTLAAKQLVVSYPRADLSGQSLLPSVIVSQIKSLFPGLSPEQPEPDLFLAGDSAAFALLAGEYGKGTALEATLRSHLGEDNRTLRRMARSRKRQPHLLADRTLARGLFGGRMRLSPTRVERYYRCPFSYFAADGLRIRPRHRVEFSPLESGSVIHNVLQVMVQRYGGKGLADLEDEQLRAEIEQVIREYLTERVEDLDRLPARFKYLFTRLTGMLARLLKRLGQEFSQSEFAPVAYELPISTQEGVEPLHLETPDGVQVLVEGVVDRVDVMEKNGKRYVRVIDYKSGAKTFALHDILYGINMQMLLYLFTIQEQGKGELEDCIPAGVLYLPVRERFITADRGEGEDKVAGQREKQWRMSGLLLEDEEVLRSMERDLRGIFIPAKLGKNGMDAGSSLAGRAEMGKLSHKVQELVVQMAQSLADGGIAASPTRSADLDPCAYCDYRTVCGYEPGDPVREVAKVDQSEVLKLLAEEEQAYQE